jgi:O-Antigen ligase
VFKVKSLNKTLKLAGALLVLGICLFGSSSAFLFNSFLGPILQDLLTAIRDPQTQMLIMLCACFYFILLTLFQGGPAVWRFWSLGNPMLWLAIVLFTATFSYAFNSPTASESTQALTFLVGAVLGRGASSLSAWQKQRGGATGHILNVLILLFLIASFWHFGTDHGYEYRNQTRWTGPWDNPNIFGLLMGAGTILAASQFIQSLKTKVQSRKPEIASWKLRGRKYWRWILAFLCFFATILMGRGLLHSYSRGAWIATLCGLAYLITKSECKMRNAEVLCGLGISRFFDRTRRNWISVSVIILSVGILIFWRFGYAKHEVIASRVFSAANVNDFSWRNRIAAWEGALQITAEHPWLGAGWNQPEPLYQHYYLPPKLDDSAAIQMNDYLMLGATLGIPVPFCFGMYLWLSLTRKPKCVKSGKQETEKSEKEIGWKHCPTIDRPDPGTQSREPLQLDWLQTTCRAGAIVLTIGFWFDGGLFMLATASVFWILLELGSMGNCEIRKNG